MRFILLLMKFILVLLNFIAHCIYCRGLRPVCYTMVLEQSALHSNLSPEWGPDPSVIVGWVWLHETISISLM